MPASQPPKAIGALFEALDCTMSSAYMPQRICVVGTSLVPEARQTMCVNR